MEGRTFWFRAPVLCHLHPEVLLIVMHKKNIFFYMTLYWACTGSIRVLTHPRLFQSHTAHPPTRCYWVLLTPPAPLVQLSGIVWNRDFMSELEGIESDSSPGSLAATLIERDRMNRSNKDVC